MSDGLEWIAGGAEGQAENAKLHRLVDKGSRADAVGMCEAHCRYADVADTADVGIGVVDRAKENEDAHGLQRKSRFAFVALCAD